MAPRRRSTSKSRSGSRSSASVDGAERGARLGHVDRRGFDQLKDFVGARVVTRHRFEVAAGAGECARRRLGVITIEPIESPAAAVEDRLRVREPALVGREPLGFIGTEPQRVELIELEAKEVESGCTVFAVHDNFVELAPELLPPPSRFRDSIEQLVMGAEVVHEEPLAVPVEQQMMRVLTVNVDEVFAELAQQVRGRRTIVDECARSAPGTDYAPHDALARSRHRARDRRATPGPVHSNSVSNTPQASARSAPARSMFALARAPRSSPSASTTYGFPCARLAGERSHPRRAVELEAVNDREGSDRQVREHAERRLLRVPSPSAASLSVSRSIRDRRGG